MQLDKAAFTLAYPPPSAPTPPQGQQSNGQQHPPLKPLRESALLQKLDRSGGGGGKYSSGEEIFRSTSRLGGKVGRIPTGYVRAAKQTGLVGVDSSGLGF